MANLLYPYSNGDIAQVGFGFDPVSGTARSKAGILFSSVKLIENPSDPYNSAEDDDYAYNSSSYSTCVSYSQSAQGGGLGIGTSESVGGSISASFSKTSVHLYLNFHVKKGSSKIDTTSPDIELTDDARALLDKCLSQNSLSDFFDEFGTHLIIGYHHGGACALSYHSEWSTAALATEFHAKIKEKATALGVSEKSQESIDAAFKAMSEGNSSTVSANFIGPTPSVSLQTVQDMYDASSAYKDLVLAGDLPTISYVVAPWTSLSVFNSLIGSSVTILDLDPEHDPYLGALTSEITSLQYIEQAARSFVSSGLFAGNTQLQAVQQLESEATHKISLITGRIRQNVLANQAFSEVDVNYCIDPARNSAQLDQELDTEMGRFTVSWYLYIGDSGGRKPPVGLLRDKNGDTPAAYRDSANDWHLNGQIPGNYFNWKSTETQRLKVAKTEDGTSNYAEVKWDSRNGTIQAMYSDKSNGQVLKVIGSQNALSAYNAKMKDEGLVSCSWNKHSYRHFAITAM